jgi:protein gp37
MGKTAIDWPNLDYTYNPVVGCPRNCEYCVVRNRVWPRIKHLYGGCSFSEVRIVPGQIEKPGNIKKPSTFFVGFYSDIEFWPMSFTELVIDKIKSWPQHTFMFLSKRSKSYLGFRWPSNTLQGLTLTGQETADVQQRRIELLEKMSRPYLSMEPLMGSLEVNIPNNFEHVIVGAMTGKDPFLPPRVAIESIYMRCRPEVVYWKKNIKPFL